MLGEPRRCRARFVLSGSDRPGGCSGLGYARSPGFGGCDRHLLAAVLSRRHPASRTPSRGQAPRGSTRKSGLGGSRPTRPAAVAGTLTITGAWRSADGLAERRRHRARCLVGIGGCCPARGGVIDSYSSADEPASAGSRRSAVGAHRLSRTSRGPVVRLDGARVDEWEMVRTALADYGVSGA
jgi:hypothetical protein